MTSASGNSQGTSRRRWQFGIRSLLILMAVAAILLVGYRETVGRLELEGPIQQTRRGLILLGVVPAGGVEAEFDQQAFVAVAQKKLELVARRHRLDPIDFSVHRMHVDGTLCIKYDCPRWGRTRFDARKLRYVFDDADPVAQARNDAIGQAFFDAAIEWAKHDPAAVRVEHHGRLHQIVTKPP